MTAPARPRRRLPPSLDDDLVLAAKGGDEAARVQLVHTFQPLIASVARAYRASASVDRLEFMQEGAAGLLAALERYDPAYGTPFWAYAAWWVRQSMQQLVAQLTRPIVLSDRAYRQLARVRDARRATLRDGGHEPSSAQLAEATGLTSDQVDHLVAVERTPRALEEPVPGGDGASSTFGEMLADPLAEEGYERALDSPELEGLSGLLAGLSERSRAVVRARYGFDGTEHSLREIGAQLGLSAERVRQIQQEALGEMREAAGLV